VTASADAEHSEAVKTLLAADQLRARRLRIALFVIVLFAIVAGVLSRGENHPPAGPLPDHLRQDKVPIYR
jgi:hypothetical protein